MKLTVLKQPQRGANIHLEKMFFSFSPASLIDIEHFIYLFLVFKRYVYSTNIYIYIYIYIYIKVGDFCRK